VAEEVGAVTLMAIRDVAVVLMLILGRGLYVYFQPYRECRWCRPGGLVGGSLPARMAGHQPERKRKRHCWRCRGTKLTRRFGAWHAHKVRDSLHRAWEERGAD
jgi:hypothetical protein